MADGVERSTPLPPDLTTGWDDLARSVTDLEHGKLELTLFTDESVTLDLGWPDGRDNPPAAVPIVYLDQNHWITLARQVRSPEKVAVADRDPATTLIGLAEAGAILLPISAAHISEVAPFGKHRRDLALTMLGLSRGWQVRSPLDVRQRELAAAIAGREPRCDAAVFTLEPGIVFSDPPTPVPTPSDFPAVWKEMHRRVVSATANVAAMLEDDDPTDTRGVAERQRWLDAYRAHAANIHEQKPSAEQVRLIAHATLVNDLSDETKLAARSIGASDADLAAWITDRSAADYERAPQLRGLEEILYHRLRNPGDPWEANDLLDMHALSCAAGYADLVVAEKKFGDYLQRARRRYPENAEVVTTLADAAQALE